MYSLRHYVQSLLEMNVTFNLSGILSVIRWFQICGAAEEKARRPKSVFITGTCRRDWLEERSKRLHLIGDKI